jgi:pyruvate,water dikinase
MSDPNTLSWEPPDAGEWDFDSAHQHTVLTATAQAGMPESMAEGFKLAFGRLGLPLSHMAAQPVNGWLYLSAFVHGAPRKGNGKEPPGILIKLMSRIPPSARKRIRIAQDAIDQRVAMAQVERWEQGRNDFIEGNLALQDIEPAELSDDELVAHLDATVSRGYEGMTLHFDLISQALPVGEYLLAIDDWGIDREVGAKAAFHSVPSTVESNERLAAIAAALGDVSITSLDDIRAHSPAAAAALDDFLRHHGTRPLGDDYSVPNVCELPGAVLSLIEQARVEPIDEKAAIAAAVASCREQVGDADRHRFDRLLSDAQRAYAALDDNSNVTAAWTGGLIRRAHLEAASRLVDRGILPTADDVWALTHTEIGHLLTGTDALTDAEIADRIAHRAACAAATPPAHLGSPPSPDPDLSLLPAPVAKNTREMMTFIGAKFGDDTAIGVGEGAVTGRAVVARSADEAMKRIEPGDILVTSLTTPAYNGIMALLGGIVTATGGPNGHTAIVARELGIPGVVGKADALDTIPDGATIQLDPAAATVSVVG